MYFICKLCICVQPAVCCSLGRVACHETSDGLAREMKVHALTYTFYFQVRQNHAYDHRNRMPNEFTCHYEGQS